MKLIDLIENKISLLEYSEKVIQQLIQRWRGQVTNLDEPTIRRYIVRFDQLKGVIKRDVERKDDTTLAALPKELIPKDNKDLRCLDILQYKKFLDLEKIVDRFPAPPSSMKAVDAENDGDTNADKIYDKDGIEIYKGDSQHKCVYYGHGTGRHYSWCISYTSDQNRYAGYRFMGLTSRMFYFVFDRSRSSNTRGGNSSSNYADPYHVIVIHVYENGRYGLSDANNAGDREVKSWEELSQFLPAELWNKIKGLKSYFKYVDPSEEEKVQAALSGKELTFEQFKSLSYKNKKLVIQTGRPLKPEMIELLDNDLKSLYINYFNAMPFRLVSTNLPLVKRYIVQQFDRNGGKTVPDSEILENIKSVVAEAQKENFDSSTIQKLNSSKTPGSVISDHFNGDGKEVIAFLTRAGVGGQPVNADYLEYMDENQRKRYFKKFSEKPCLNYSHIAKYFPEYAHELVNAFIDALIYLPDYMVPFMTSDQKRIWELYMPAYADSEVTAIDDNVKMLTNYSFTPTPLSEKTFLSFSPEVRKRFVDFIKGIITKNGGLTGQYETLGCALVDAQIKGGNLYIKFSDSGLTNCEALKESKYHNWDKYTMLKRAGIIR